MQKPTMWPFNRKKRKRVIVALGDNDARYLGKDLLFYRNIDNALPFSNEIDAAHMVLRLALKGVCATSVEVEHS